MKNLSYITISDITCPECGFTKTEEMHKESGITNRVIIKKMPVLNNTGILHY